MSGGRTPRGSSRREWGWYRLADEEAARLVAEAGIGSGDLVLDLGAGTGALVGPLLDTGAHVVAVELHPRRVETLRTRWADPVGCGQLTVVQADVLEVPWPRRPFRVVANPPYGIASAVVRRLLEARSPLRSAYVVLPLAVVRRYAEQAPLGSARGHRLFELSVARRLPRSTFRPRPRVDSAVLAITRRSPVRKRH